MLIQELYTSIITPTFSQKQKKKKLLYIYTFMLEQLAG